MHKLIEYTCDELKELEKKVASGQRLSSAETQYMDMLAHAKKNLLKGEEMMSEEGYSNYDGYSTRYDDRYSRRTRRDSMGRYSRGHTAMVDDLHRMMADAPDERTRQEFQSFINKIERM